VWGKHRKKRALHTEALQACYVDFILRGYGATRRGRTGDLLITKNHRRLQTLYWLHAKVPVINNLGKLLSLKERLRTPQTDGVLAQLPGKAISPVRVLPPRVGPPSVCAHSSNKCLMSSALGTCSGQSPPGMLVHDGVDETYLLLRPVRGRLTAINVAPTPIPPNHFGRAVFASTTSRP